jgi:hypothetical protein
LRSYIIAEKEKQPNKFKYFEEKEGSSNQNKKGYFNVYTTVIFVESYYLITIAVELSF